MPPTKRNYPPKSPEIFFKRKIWIIISVLFDETRNHIEMKLSKKHINYIILSPLLAYSRFQKDWIHSEKTYIFLVLLYLHLFYVLFVEKLRNCRWPLNPQCYELPMFWIRKFITKVQYYVLSAHVWLIAVLREKYE